MYTTCDRHMKQKCTKEELLKLSANITSTGSHQIKIIALL